MCRLDLNQQVLDQENEFELRWMVMVASLQAQNSSTYSDLRAERWVQEADHPDTIQVEGRNQWFLGQQTSKRASERLECRTHTHTHKHSRGRWHTMCSRGTPGSFDKRKNQSFVSSGRSSGDESLMHTWPGRGWAVLRSFSCLSTPRTVPL